MASIEAMTRGRIRERALFLILVLGTDGRSAMLFPLYRIYGSWANMKILPFYRASY